MQNQLIGVAAVLSGIGRILYGQAVEFAGKLLIEKVGERKTQREEQRNDCMIGEVHRTR